MCRWNSKAGVDFILVGDSVGTTLLGYETTIPVTIDDDSSCNLTVKREVYPDCLVVAELPFGEAEVSHLTDCLIHAAGSCRIRC